MTNFKRFTGMKSFYLLGLLACAVYSAEGIREKKAVLILPDQIECKSGSGRYLSGEIGIRWDENEPLELNTWRRSDSKGGPSSAKVMVDIRVYDEGGKEMDRQFFVSIPPIPDGRLVMRKGEYRRLGFFLWNGRIVFPKPGNYSAVVTLREAWSGKTNVSFVSNRRWFRVVEATLDYEEL